MKKSITSTGSATEHPYSPPVEPESRMSLLVAGIAKRLTDLKQDNKPKGRKNVKNFKKMMVAMMLGLALVVTGCSSQPDHLAEQCGNGRSNVENVDELEECMPYWLEEGGSSTDTAGDPRDVLTMIEGVIPDESEGEDGAGRFLAGEFPKGHKYEGWVVTATTYDDEDMPSASDLMTTDEDFYITGPGFVVWGWPDDLEQHTVDEMVAVGEPIAEMVGGTLVK